MKNPPTSREIQRWFPRSWDEIAGNSQIVETFWSFITNGGFNALFTGPSRTGKTRTISLGIKAALCSERTSELNPCHACPSCRAVAEARDAHTGILSVMTSSCFSYLPIDCERVSSEQLRNLGSDFDLEHVKTIVYLDEVAALRRRKLDNLLLKPIDESSCIWIASAITVIRRSQGTYRRTDGLSAPMRGRFGTKVGTALPGHVELKRWIQDRCRAWQIAIEQEDETIPLLISRSGHRVGYVLHAIADAAARARTLSFDRVERFNFDAVD